MDILKKVSDPGRRALLIWPVVAGAIFLVTRGKEDKVALKVQEVMLDEANALVAAGALVLDVRNRAAYEGRHIAGALLAPLDELPRLMAGALAYAKSMPILVYCGDGSTLGPRGTHALNAAGFGQAVNLKPGISGWASAGLPVESGAGKSA